MGPLGRRRENRALPRVFALTGTPGTGKSRCAKLLPERLRVWEVGELARKAGKGRKVPGGWEVDLDGLGRWLSRQPPPDRTTVVVGHLAHLLPIQQVMVLRCEPIELFERMRRSRRRGTRDRWENVRSEAVDSILVECLELERSVREIDTTGRSPESVAAEVARHAERPWRARYGTVDWLSDPRVTDFLLRGPR